jgi:hypothetical protein
MTLTPPLRLVVMQPGPDQSGASASAAESVDLDDLATGWLALPDLGAALDVAVSTLRQWVREGRLITVPHGPRRIASVPSDLVRDGALVRGLASTLTVLIDGGFSPVGALAWLLTVDPVLEVRPVDFMAEGRDVAVRRRAMMLAL